MCLYCNSHDHRSSDCTEKDTLTLDCLISDVAPKNQVDTSKDPKFYLGIMRNVEREISRQKRKHTQNWVLVQDYLLGHTSKGGSTSCYIQCRWMGVDPEGYTFR